MPRIDLDGFGVHVEIAGDGPPIVLLHGFTGAAGTWKDLVPELAAEYTTIAPDLVGHGRTDAPAEHRALPHGARGRRSRRAACARWATSARRG